MCKDISLAAQQFSPRASAYVNSAVHAAGEDLEALKAFVAERGLARVLEILVAAAGM